MGYNRTDGDMDVTDLVTRLIRLEDRVYQDEGTTPEEVDGFPATSSIVTEGDDIERNFYVTEGDTNYHEDADYGDIIINKSTDGTATVSVSDGGGPPDPVIFGSVSYGSATYRWESGTGTTDALSDVTGHWVASNDESTVYIGSGTDVHAITAPNTYDGVVVSNGAEIKSLAASKNYIFTGDVNSDIKKWDKSGTEVWSVTKSSGDIDALSAGFNGDLIAGDQSNAHYIESDGTTRWSVDVPNGVNDAAFYDSNFSYICGTSVSATYPDPTGIQKLDNFDGSQIWKVNRKCTYIAVHANDEVVGTFGPIFRYTSDGKKRWEVDEGGTGVAAFPNGASVTWDSEVAIRHFDESGNLVYSTDTANFADEIAGLDGTYGVQQW